MVPRAFRFAPEQREELTKVLSRYLNPREASALLGSLEWDVNREAEHSAPRAPSQAKFRGELRALLLKALDRTSSGTLGRIEGASAFRSALVESLELPLRRLAFEAGDGPGIRVMATRRKDGKNVTRRLAVKLVKPAGGRPREGPREDYTAWLVASLRDGGLDARSMKRADLEAILEVLLPAAGYRTPARSDSRGERAGGMKDVATQMVVEAERQEPPQVRE